MLKEIQSCFGFALLYSVIGPQNSNHSLNQQGAKLKPLGLALVIRVSRALGSLVGFTLSYRRLLIIFSFLLIGRSEHLVWFQCTHRKALYQLLLHRLLLLPYHNYYHHYYYHYYRYYQSHTVKL